MNFEFLFFLLVKTIETNLLRKYYLQVTTNDERTCYVSSDHALISISSIFHWYQTKVSQIVSCNIFRFRFRGLFTFTLHFLHSRVQQPASLLSVSFDSLPSAQLACPLFLPSSALDKASDLNFLFVNKVFKKSTKIQNFAKIMRLKDEVYW